MKGLEERKDGQGIWLQIKHSSLCQESKTPREGFKQIEVENPRTREKVTKYIKQYSGLTAYVDEIEWKDTGDKYEQQFMSWLIKLINEEGERCVLELPFSSRASTRFMKVAENLDFSQPVTFRVWHDTREDKTAFLIGQGFTAEGKTIPVKQKYTQDNMGKCPEGVKNRMGKWNFDAQNEFLYEQMMNVVLPKVAAASAKREFVKPDAPETGSGEPDFAQSEPEFLDEGASF